MSKVDNITVTKPQCEQLMSLHLVIQLFVELGYLCLTLLFLSVSEFDPREGAMGRSGCWLVIVGCTVKGLDLCFSLLLVELFLYWYILSCRGQQR